MGEEMALIILQNRTVIGRVYGAHMRRKKDKEEEKTFYCPKPVSFNLNPSFYFREEKIHQNGRCREREQAKLN